MAIALGEVLRWPFGNRITARPAVSTEELECRVAVRRQMERAVRIMGIELQARGGGQVSSDQAEWWLKEHQFKIVDNPVELFSKVMDIKWGDEIQRRGDNGEGVINNKPA